MLFKYLSNKYISSSNIHVPSWSEKLPKKLSEGKPAVLNFSDRGLVIKLLVSIAGDGNQFGKISKGIVTFEIVKNLSANILKLAGISTLITGKYEISWSILTNDQNDPIAIDCKRLHPNKKLEKIT